MDTKELEKKLKDLKLSESEKFELLRLFIETKHSGFLRGIKEAISIMKA